jgi:pyruvate dehydrogenase E2 component (dihydrolipoamide acetyltransferase)
MFGVRGFAAIVDSPQAAILAVGEIAERPVVRDGEVVPGRVMEITLSCDHRILYGAEGAGFLAAVRRLLEEPVGLAL